MKYLKFTSISYISFILYKAFDIDFFYTQWPEFFRLLFAIFIVSGPILLLSWLFECKNLFNEEND